MSRRKKTEAVNSVVEEGLSRWECSAFLEEFRKSGLDAKKVKAVYDGGDRTEVTLAFNVGIRGVAKLAGAKVEVNSTEFKQLANTGFVREVLTDEQIALIDAVVAKKAGAKTEQTEDDTQE